MAGARNSGPPDGNSAPYSGFGHHGAALLGPDDPMAGARNSGPPDGNSAPSSGFGHQAPALPGAARTMAGNHGGGRSSTDRCAPRFAAHLHTGSSVFLGRSRDH